MNLLIAIPALLVVWLPARYWRQREWPWLHAVCVLSGALTFVAGFWWGLHSYLIHVKREGPLLSLLAFFTYFAYPSGQLAVYLLFTGFVRVIAAYFFEPIRDPGCLMRGRGEATAWSMLNAKC